MDAPPTADTLLVREGAYREGGFTLSISALSIRLVEDSTLTVRDEIKHENLTPPLSLWLTSAGIVEVRDNNGLRKLLHNVHKDPNQVGPWRFSITDNGRMQVTGRQRSRWNWRRSPGVQRFCVLLHGHRRCGKDSMLHNCCTLLRGTSAAVGEHGGPVAGPASGIVPETQVIDWWVMEETNDESWSFTFKVANTPGIDSIPDAEYVCYAKVSADLCRVHICLELEACLQRGEPVDLVLFFIDPAHGYAVLRLRLVCTPYMMVRRLSAKDLAIIKLYRRYCLVLLVLAKCDTYSRAELNQRMTEVSSS